MAFLCADIGILQVVEERRERFLRGIVVLLVRCIVGPGPEQLDSPAMMLHQSHQVELALAVSGGREGVEGDAETLAAARRRGPSRPRSGACAAAARGGPPRHDVSPGPRASLRCRVRAQARAARRSRARSPHAPRFRATSRGARADARAAPKDARAASRPPPLRRQAARGVRPACRRAECRRNPRRRGPSGRVPPSRARRARGRA